MVWSSSIAHAGPNSLEEETGKEVRIRRVEVERVQARHAKSTTLGCGMEIYSLSIREPV